MKLVKYLLLAIVITFCGCKSTVENSDHDKVIMGSGFNESVYVWESFVFPSNRVESIKK